MIETDTISIPNDRFSRIPPEAFRVDEVRGDDHGSVVQLITGYSPGRPGTGFIDVKRISHQSFRARVALREVQAKTVTRWIRLPATASDDVSKATFATNEGWQDWRDLFKKLDGLSLLTDGWNGYNAIAPAAAAISNARHFLKVLQSKSIVPQRLAPSAVGGVAITSRRHDRKVVVEFFNNGLISGLFADDAAETLDTKKISNTSVDFDGLVSDIQDYLNG